MPPTSPPPDTPVRRRTVLAAGALAVTAGCLGQDDTDDTPEEASADEERFTNVDSYSLRFETDEHVLYDADGEELNRQYVIDDSDVEEFAIEGDPTEGSVEELEAFLTDLDYEHESAVLTLETVQGCERLGMLYVSERNGGGLRLRTCWTHREPDVACSTGATHTQLLAVSVPVSFSTEPSGFSFGTRRNCAILEEEAGANGGGTDDEAP